MPIWFIRSRIEKHTSFLTGFIISLWSVRARVEERRAFGLSEAKGGSARRGVQL